MLSYVFKYVNFYIRLDKSLYFISLRVMTESRSLVRSRDSVALKCNRLPSLGEKDVLVKVAVAGICRTDQYAYNGTLQLAKDTTLGHEFSGVVYGVGSSLSDELIGRLVAINPIISCEDCAECRCLKPMLCQAQRMLGIDVDGAFGEWVVIRSSQVYPVESDISPYEVSFAEPVAAALGLLDINLPREGRGAIVGRNRLALLSSKVLSTVGYSCPVISIDDLRDSSNEFDYLIESEIQLGIFDQLFQSIKPGGTVVLKSRSYSPLTIIPREMVLKGIRLIAASYGDFSQAVKLIESKILDFKDLIGETYHLTRFQDAFRSAAGREDRKVFLVPEF